LQSFVYKTFVYKNFKYTVAGITMNHILSVTVVNNTDDIYKKNIKYF